MLSLIAAMSKNRIIGAKNKIPWHIPEDLKHFREVTTGHPIIMGRKTFDSVGRPLPNRTNIVISRDPALVLEGAVVVNSLEGALERACRADVPGCQEVFVIGGAEIYRQAIARADRIYLTVIDKKFPGDAYFPEFKMEIFREVSREKREEPIPFEFILYEKKTIQTRT